MSIHIRNIHATKLGPLDDIEMEFGAVNLIYGHNEQGKTHLVDFLIRALFRTSGVENIRPLTGAGSVQISGLAPAAVQFNLNPKSKKLEDHLNKLPGGLPPNLARLLIVRAGELAFAQNESDGVNRAILKEYLSNEGFLDSVQNKILATIRNSQLGPGGEITGSKMGPIKEREGFRESLNELDRLSERIQEVYSGGSRALLHSQIVQTQEQIELLQKARRHHGWMLSQELMRLNKELARLPRDVLQNLEKEVLLFADMTASHTIRQQRQAEKAQAAQHFGWLTAAINLYKASVSQPANQLPGIILWALAGAGLVAAVVCSFLKIPAGTLLFVILVAILGSIDLIRTRTLLHQAGDIKERQNILTEYSQRFGERCSGLPALEARWKLLQPISVAADVMQEEIEKEALQLEKNKSIILGLFQKITGRESDDLNWSDRLTQWENQLDEMDEKRQHTQSQLDRLGLAETDYLSTDPGIPFNAADLELLNSEAEQLKSSHDLELSALNDLKAAACQKTADPASVSWDELIHHLSLKRIDVAQKYRLISAKIAAGIVVNTELETFRKQEEDRIQAGLQSPLVSQPLHQLTRRYTQIEYENNQLRLVDEFNNFSLTELSTGAQEQVLLALRIGFAQKWAGQEKMFLILDDAFQHSDWQRREYLVDKMVDLATQGWQILYFTMDDHIRSLFETRVKPLMHAQYAYHELPNPHS